MITLNNISKQFGKLKVLDHVSTSCDQSECIALIGPNGSGKTTLIKSILGMVIPDSGSITFNGKDIANNFQYRDEIGYMPQIGRYPDNMTIGQVLGMMKDIRGKSGELDEKIISEKDKGKLVLITSHILSDLDDLVTRIIYMQDGKLVFHKSMEELRRDTGEERLVKSIAQVMVSNYE